MAEVPVLGKRMEMRHVAQACCALSLMGAAWPGLAQGGNPAPIPAWVTEKTRDWSVSHYDVQGHSQWTGKKWNQSPATDQRAEALARLRHPNERRAALWALTAWPLNAWADEALKNGDGEAAQFLYLRGYRQSGADPYAYLGSGDRVERPWTHGLGLHLDQGAWRFQWIPSPALFTQTGNATLPKGLEQAAQPGVLIHLKQLRPGLEKLVSLAGGTAAPANGMASGPTSGIVPALAQGSRAGFAVRHLEPWLNQASPALEPLANREAWVLHYGTERDGGRNLQGTLIFIPGELPGRTQLMMALLKLNPLSSGARSRVVKWTGPGATTEVQQLRGSGGVFHLIQKAEGTWISDREAPLRALLFPGPDPTLGERREWARVALSAMAANTELSFWISPRIGADAAFENQAVRRRMANLQQGTWPNPFVAKAAPRTGALTVSLGAGPTEKLLDSILRVDDNSDFELPQMPQYADGGRALSPSQMKEFQDAQAKAQDRQRQRAAVRQDVTALQTCLDLRGAALVWNGWVGAPTLSPSEKASLTELGRLRHEDPWRAMQAQRDGKISAFGGFGEPGMTPSLALALPVQGAKRVQVENLLKRLLPKLFKGQTQKQSFGAYEIHRVVTAQAFRPAWSVVSDMLVLGTDEAAVKAVAAGLQGQAPTLADSESKAWARMEIDGARASKELENLLLAFLRSRTSSGWWIGETTSEDEAASELAFSLGPFLGAVKALGPVKLEWNWTAAGLEGRPR